MKLKSVKVNNYRAIDQVELTLDPSLTVLHGNNAHGKTSVLSAIAVGLAAVPTLLPEVSGIGFLRSDRRRSALPPRVSLTTTDQVSWSQGGIGRSSKQALKRKIARIVEADTAGHGPIELPIMAFYDTDRAVFDAPQRRRGFKSTFPRYFALQGALSARTNFRDFFKWFYAKQHEELIERNERRNFDYRLKDIEAVRQAIGEMVDGVSEPRVKHRPLRFVVTVESSDRSAKEELSLNQLSGGYRIMLALAADLARRMAQGNPHLDDPLTSEAIVLIDEVELHLHPSWQQRILSDLTRTFPNTQFIVSTHSPQVLTDVRPEQIVELRLEEGRIVAGTASAPTYGAEAGDVLFTVMGVDERPSENEFAKALKRYMGLINDGKGDTESAHKLRENLDRLSPHDPDLERADMELRRREMLARTSASQ